MRHRLPLLSVLALALALAVSATPALAADPVERRSAVVLAVEKARPGVVSIRTNEMVTPRYYDWFTGETTTGPARERDLSLGSGAIFHPAGFVITNAHVIARASRIFVQYMRSDGRDEEREARTVAVDLDADLAILKLIAPAGAAESFPYVPLGRSDDLMLGETVIAIGNPFKLGITVTTGIVSALRRTIRPSDAQDVEFKDFVQIDAAINPGNSGGPLLDVTGRWIGVNTMILNRSMGAEGIGFAIPADRVRDMIGRTFKRRLVDGEWTGFDLEASKTGAPLVREVFVSGPAHDAGLRPGDRIVAVSGRQTPSLFDYRLAEVDVPAGDALRLEVAHDGEHERVVTVQLRADALAIAKVRLGFTARDAAPADTQSLGVRPKGGVVITEILPGGPAERVRLRKDDVVTSVGTPSNERGFKIRTIDDLLLVLEMIRSGDAVVLGVQRVVTDRFGDARVHETSGTLIAD